MNNNLLKRVTEARTQFEMDVEAACSEVQEMAKDVAKAIGEISVDEAKKSMITLFTDCIYAQRHHATFQGKKIGGE